MNLDIAKLKFLSLSALLCATLSAEAQQLRSVSAHDDIHQDLIASQRNIQDQIKLNETKEFMDELLKEEQEPEIDIYTESWNSDLVNPYAGQEVPDNVRIDVSEYAMPVPGYVTSPYGYRPRFRRSHKGIDLKLQTGDTVRAAFSGKVRLTRYERRGYGYYVIIRHHNGLETVYGHLSKFLVKPNQDVKVGDPIALGGNTGRSTGPHLHFETRFLGEVIYTKARNYAPDTSVQAEKSQNGNASQATTYRIRKGDTLGKIASRYGVSVNSICRLNGISKNSTLRVGKVLRIK